MLQPWVLQWPRARAVSIGLLLQALGRPVRKSSWFEESSGVVYLFRFLMLLRFQSVCQSCIAVSLKPTAQHASVK